MTQTFFVRHQNGNEQLFIEYGSLEGAQETAQFLAETQGGATTVFVATELASYWRGNDLKSQPAEPDQDITIELTALERGSAETVALEPVTAPTNNPNEPSF